MSNNLEHKKHKSLKIKITLWYALFMLILTASFLLVLLMISNRNTDENTQENLINTVQTVSTQIDGTKRTDIKNLLDDEIDNQIIAIYSDRGFLLAGEEPNNFDSVCEFEDDTIKSVIAGSRVYYVYDKKVELGENDLWVRGYVRVLTAQETQETFLYFGLALIPILVLIMLGGGYILIKRALKPLDEMIAETSEIVSADNLDRRVPVPKSGDELYALGTSMNQMLTKLEASFKREKQFTSDVSHELRTPIAIVLSQCESSKNDVDVNSLKNDIDVIEKQSKRMKNLIEQLLQLSRMESGKIKPELKNVNLSNLVHELIEEQKIIHPGEDRVETAISEEITVNCDIWLVERAFRNLITNAHQYGGGSYHIELYRKANNIMFSVKDYGEGIPEEEIDKIWNRFYRGDKSRKFTGGYGLGLSMVKDIASLHNWSVQVNSKMHEGTEFLVIIPCNTSASDV